MRGLRRATPSVLYAGLWMARNSTDYDRLWQVIAVILHRFFRCNLEINPITVVNDRLVLFTLG